MLPVRILLPICPEGGFPEQGEFFFHVKQARRLEHDHTDLFGDFFAIPSSDNCPMPNTREVNPLPPLLT